MDSDTVVMGSMELRFLVDESQGSGDLVMFEWTIPPQARVPVPHFHREVDEVVYALAGVTTSTLDGTAHALRPGQHLVVPRGAVHHHANLHEETARVLIVLNPGTIGKAYFTAMAREVNGPGKPDLARMKEIMLAHGLIAA